MKINLVIVLLAAIFVAACSVNNGRGNMFGAMGESTKLVGIWKMHPLRGGIANVAEFTHTGESRLYPYNCLTKEQEEPEIERYVVDWGSRTIQIDGNGTSQTLKIVSISDTSLELSQNIAGQYFIFRYTRGSDISPFCGPDEWWERERAKRMPHSSSGVK